MKQYVMLLVVALSSLLFAEQASAQVRTVCLQLGFRDPRFNCPGDGVRSTTAAWGTCNPTGYSSALGLEFELWDFDTAPDGDDFIGSYRVGSASGLICVNINWSDASDPPDLYVNFFPRVNAGGSRVRAQTNNGTAAAQNWGDFGWYTTRNWGVFNNCAAGATCTLSGGAMYVPSNDPADEISGVFGSLNGAYRVLDHFGGGINGTQDISLRIDTLSQWPMADRCPAACVQTRAEVRMPTDGNIYNDGLRISHEMGHLLHLREFNKDGWHPGTACPGGGWDYTTNENQACATTEGWANYVAAASWWNQGLAGARPQIDGFQMEDENPVSGTCANNVNMPGMASRAFWDLGDANNEGGTAVSGWVPDQTSHSNVTLLNNWDNFPAGTGNAQDAETGANGVNIWDYAWNAWNTGGGWGPLTNTDTIAYHNCLNASAWP